ncbi:MAG: hypothetical protein IJH64_00695 [Oscillospiraceae bacterium]|nr:hypothetical protein [Oscillospiraceae bacterium]
MDMNVNAVLHTELDVTKSENVKHFERMKELLEELVSEMNQINYNANVTPELIRFPEKPNE